MRASQEPVDGKENWITLDGRGLRAAHKALSSSTSNDKRSSRKRKAGEAVDAAPLPAADAGALNAAAQTLLDQRLRGNSRIVGVTHNGRCWLGPATHVVAAFLGPGANASKLLAEIPAQEKLKIDVDSH